MRLLQLRDESLAEKELHSRLTKDQLLLMITFNAIQTWERVERDFLHGERLQTDGFDGDIAVDGSRQPGPLSFTTTSKQHIFADIHYTQLELGKYNIWDITVDIMSTLVMYRSHAVKTDLQKAIETYKENIKIRLWMLRATLLPQETASSNNCDDRRNIYGQYNKVVLFTSSWSASWKWKFSMGRRQPL